MLSTTKIILVLILSYDWSRLNGMLAIFTFVDHSLSLIISFLDSQASFALTTTNTCSLKLQALYSQATPWGWTDGLEHNSRIHLCKSFYEQVFLRGSTRKPLKRWKRYSPTSRKGRVFKAPSRHSYKIRRWDFLSYELLNLGKQRIFCQWATYKGSGSTGKPRKPLSPPGLVYCHKKGDVRKSRKEKKRKRPRKARRWLQRRQGSVCPKPRIPFFWFTSIWVLKWPISVEVSAPTRLGLRGSNVRRKFRKRTTLRSKSSTLKGLLYAAKAVP